MQNRGTIRRDLYLQECCSRLFPQLNNPFSAVRKFALNLSFPRILGEAAKSPCSQGNARAAITPSPLWSILVGRGLLCNVVFRKSKQKLGIIHFRVRMMNSSATSAEQIRMRASILHIRMKEISAGDKGGIKQTLCSEKNEMGKLHSLLNKIQCSVLFVRR